MAHIAFPEGAPGIIGPMIAYPETQEHLNGLAEALLRGPSSLTSGERETIAAYVSAGNECRFCCESHAAAARAHLGEQTGSSTRCSPTRPARRLAQDEGPARHRRQGPPRRPTGPGRRRRAGAGPRAPTTRRSTTRS